MNVSKNMPIIFRRGKKIFFRPIEKADAPTMQRWQNDPEVSRFLTSTRPFTLTDEESWVEGLGKRKEDVVLAIEVINGPFIGTMGLHGISWTNRTATTGTCIGEKEHQGKGYGTDAKMILLDYAFNTLNLRKINSSAIAYNGRSIGFNTKCGYKEEGRRKQEIFRDGEYHDKVLLAVFKEDWLPLWEEYKKDL